jgi:hypothetical protein
MAANGPNELRSLLRDVQIDGTVTINKRKLLWLLGWGQDRADAWKELLDFWEEMSPKVAKGGKLSKSDDLYFYEVSEKVVLTLLPEADLVAVRQRAGQ